jgi:hypothetical protein
VLLVERLGVALRYWAAPSMLFAIVPAHHKIALHMTSLIAWTGVDSRGPASFYLASDSRLSWSRGVCWDHGRKLFNCLRSPDVFGYCGDALFPSLFLSQAVSLVDIHATTAASSARARHEAVVVAAQKALNAYPVAQRRPFSVLHASREGGNMTSVFHVWRTDWSVEEGWRDEELPLPTESVLVLAVGSGRKPVSTFDAAWRRSDVGRTSRAVFSAFCDALRSADDPFSGGAPQLVGLYRAGYAETFGVIYRNSRYMLGTEVSAEIAGALTTEWRNELFERCDSESMLVLQGAQRHARPKQLSAQSERDAPSVSPNDSTARTGNEG